MSTDASASPVVVVTGARVGIGRAAAVAFGQTGARVALTSRSGLTGSEPAGEGSLGEAVEATAAAGAEAVGVALDLGSRSSVDEAIGAVMDRWGRIDVLVNNALCDQPGAQDTVARMDIDAFERMIVGEVVNTTYLSARVLEVSPASPVTIVNVGSAAADFVPPAPIGSGGFAFSYAADKAALHRLAPFLQLEYGSRVRAFTLNPGTVRTERLLERLGDIPGAAPPSMPAAVIRWLALDPAADAHLGAYLHASKLAAEFGLA